MMTVDTIRETTGTAGITRIAMGIGAAAIETMTATGATLAPAAITRIVMGIAAPVIETITATATTIVPPGTTKIAIGNRSAARGIGTAIEMITATTVTHGKTARTEI
jgi:hypothetical protein